MFENIMKAFKLAITDSLNFEGRASRFELFMGILCYIIVNSFVAIILSAMVFGLAFIGASFLTIVDFSLLMGFFLLWTTVASYSLSVRRFHDINKSGWFLILAFIPVVNFFWFFVTIYWHCKKGDSGENQYGSDPQNRYDNSNKLKREPADNLSANEKAALK